ncbi:MAG TPA: NADPH:quinone oxidoreductase family protein [Xanthomonadales bacterium]|nr:NADPH:quinone oxidoreductase family protein [Xanthomonadales bacterium]
MKALVCREYGPPESLVLEEMPDPVAGPGEVLVDVAAAGMNFPDVLSIAGKYQVKTPPPFIPGNEAAGTVIALGEGASRYKIGDQVILLPRNGAFASRCTVSQDMIMPVPEGLSLEQAAGFSVTYGTSYHALKQSAELQKGETLLVLGAAGGVGIAAVELGRVMGAKVIAAASSDEKVAFAMAAGADHGINYNEVSMRDVLKELTGGKGVDVVYDPVGGEIAQIALRALGWQGRHLVVGFASGTIPDFPANMALLKEARIQGTLWGVWVQRNPQAHLQNMAELAAMIKQGSLNPQVTAAYPLEDYLDAFAEITGRRVKGKIVLTMS